MIITCDECNSSFSVGDGMIKDTGSKVRCSKCDHVFVAFPQSSEDSEDLEIAEDELMPGEDDDLGLDDLDSDFVDFLEGDDAEKTITMAPDARESELDLDDFGDSLDLESGLEPDDLQEGSEGELELDLDFDEDDESDLTLDADSIDGGDLPDLADLDDLDDEKLTSDETGSELEDLDFELEAKTAALELEGDDELDLSDLGIEGEEELSAMEEPSAEQDDALDGGEGDELDLSDLEAAIDGDSATAETEASEPAELSLDSEPDETDIAESDLALETSDELDLSDLDLDLEDGEVSEETPAAASEDLDLDLASDTVPGGEEDAADELDLSDLSDIMEDVEAPVAENQTAELDLSLGLESEASAGAEDAAAVADPDDTEELDLPGLEDVIETEQTPVAGAPADDSAPDLDMDLDFQLDDGAPMNEATLDSQGDDELDFSDLEQMLESDETPSAGGTDVSMTDELDLQFDLDEPSAAGAETDAAADPGDELDLQFDLDEPSAAGAEADAVADSGEELDLQFELDEPVAAEADTDAFAAPGADAQEDDFLDIEQLLDEDEDGAPLVSEDLDGDVTDLPLEMEEALVEASNGADAELELDFDLESELLANDDEDLFEISESPDQQPESDLLAADEADFLEEAGIDETEFQDAGQTSVIGTDEFASEALTETDNAYGATHMLSTPESENAGESEVTIADQEFEPYVPQKKTRSKKPVLVVMVLILLALGVFTVPNMLGVKIPYISDIKIPYLSDLDLEIPYLSQWLNPEPQDVAGNLKIIPLGNTINGKFVDNSKSGQLFVIQGQIKNDYDHPRSYIKVTGKLFRKGKKVAKTATVYCGNTLSNSDLRAMDISAIGKKLGNRSGDRRSNFKVKTGKRVPFMIVFDKLPRNLDEYTVEVESSSI